ncbi:MAG: hypothetical protein N2167_10915 [Flavobacteriales bacterium]|nr:hypothetical protein [Flavobacteriales bacterium]
MLISKKIMGACIALHVCFSGYTQPVYGSECNKSYPEIGFELSMRCHVVEEIKDKQSVTIFNRVKNASKTRDYEVSSINLYKLENPVVLEKNIFIEESKKMLENFLNKINHQFRDFKWLNGSLYGRKLTYYPENNKANYSQYLVAKFENNDMFLEYNLELFFENGDIVALAEILSYKDISSSYANDLRSGKETIWEIFYSSPYNLKYTTAPLLRKNLEFFNFSLTLPRHYLRAYFEDQNHTLVFSPNAIWDEAITKNKKLGDVKLRFVKKLTANESFSTYAAPFLKQSSNNKLNDTEIKNLNKKITNVLVFKEMYVEDSRKIDHPYYPSKYIFEWNKAIYELSGDVSQHELLRDLYASIDVMTPNESNQAYESPNTQYKQIIDVMNAWVNDFFIKNKQGRIETPGLLGAWISRYATDLKFGNYTTYLEEEGLAPNNKRYWVALVGSFNNQDLASTEMRKWIVFFDELVTDQIKLTKSSESATKMLWRIKFIDNNNAIEAFNKMEIKVERAEVLYSVNGKTEVKHEVYIKIGSPL